MSDSDIAIKVDGVNKAFKLPHEKQSSVKGMFVGLFQGKRTYTKQQVLKDISFEIKKGEFFGIVGRNGSGKSTLLKLLAGIYTPDKGNIHVNGSLTPFIELGVGFNPELTGRENVYLNGALLGFNRKQMDAMYHEIVEFAELEKFMDQKLKNYSSGMQVRLAFSIAIRAKSDILLIDEVLAVGDEAFQRKCLDVFDSYKVNKKTVVLVTHDMGIVQKYCDKAILIHDGQLQKAGDPKTVSKKYSFINEKSTDLATSELNNQKNFANQLKIKLVDKANNTKSRYSFGDVMKIELTWSDDTRPKYAGVAIVSSTGTIVFANNSSRENLALRGRLTYELTLNLLPGRYFVMAGLFNKNDRDILDFIDEGPIFTISSINEVWQGITHLENKWSV